MPANVNTVMGQSYGCTPVKHQQLRAHLTNVFVPPPPHTHRVLYLRYPINVTFAPGTDAAWALSNTLNECRATNPAAIEEVGQPTVARSCCACVAFVLQTRRGCAVVGREASVMGQLQLQGPVEVS